MSSRSWPCPVQTSCQLPGFFGSTPVYTSASLLDSLLRLVNNAPPKRSCCQDCERKKDSEPLQRVDEANRSIFVLYAARFSKRRRASDAWFKPLLRSLWLKIQNSSNWSEALPSVTSMAAGDQRTSNVRVERVINPVCLV